MQPIVSSAIMDLAEFPPCIHFTRLCPSWQGRLHQFLVSYLHIRPDGVQKKRPAERAYPSIRESVEQETFRRFADATVRAAGDCNPYFSQTGNG
jgi:hypothetical protein